MLWGMVAGVLAILGAALVFSVGIAQFRARDALSRSNSLGPATALGVPLILVATAIGWTTHEGFSLMLWLKTIITVVALVLVSSVATNVLARAICRTDATVDPRTEPNDLRSDAR